MAEWLRNTIVVVVIGVSGWFAIDYLYLRDSVKVALESAVSKDDYHRMDLKLNTIGVKLDALGKALPEYQPQ